MPAAVLLVFLLAGLLALVPVWRLRVAGWPPAWLFVSWVTYAVVILLVMRFAALTRYLLPVLVVLYVAPFVAGPERLARLVGSRRREEPRAVIDVTPKPPPAIPPGRQQRSTGRTLHADPPGGEVVEAQTGGEAGLGSTDRASAAGPAETAAPAAPVDPEHGADTDRDTGVAS